jgi:cytochrome b pre-mRNA-processing protein 3
MSSDYIHIYNNLISLTRNKKLYETLNRNDIFSDRLYFFLLHFAFLLKNFKSDENQKKLQEIYDLNFRQLELSIREIGYGDQSINKKMKDYINLFHGMLSDIHFWNNLNVTMKIDLLKKYLSDYDDLSDIVVYFDDFNDYLSKKTLKLFLKSVIKL